MLAINGFCQTHIPQFRLPVNCNHDVFRLNITVNNPILSRIFERLANLNNNFDRAIFIIRATTEQLFFHRGALDKLHHIIVTSFIFTRRVSLNQPDML